MKDKELLSSIDLKHGFYSLPFEDEASKTLQHSHLVTTSFHNNLCNLVIAGMPPNVFNYMDDYLVATDKDLDKSGGMDTSRSARSVVFQAPTSWPKTITLKMQLLSKTSQLSGIQLQQRRTDHKPKEHKKRVEKLRQPKTKKQVRSFLVATGCLRRCISGYAKIAHPLMHLTKAKMRYIWENWKMMPYQVLNKLLSIKWEKGGSVQLIVPKALKEQLIYPHHDNNTKVYRSPAQTFEAVKN